jgi:hypothetical protein
MSTRFLVINVVLALGAAYAPVAVATASNGLDVLGG